MQRRELSQALFTTVAGAAVLSSTARAQTCTAPCYSQTADELAATPSITPINTQYPPQDLRRYGNIDPSGMTDNTSIIPHYWMRHRST